MVPEGCGGLPEGKSAEFRLGGQFGGTVPITILVIAGVQKKRRSCVLVCLSVRLWSCLVLFGVCLRSRLRTPRPP